MFQELNAINCARSNAIKEAIRHAEKHEEEWVVLAEAEEKKHDAQVSQLVRLLRHAVRTVRSIRGDKSHQLCDGCGRRTTSLDCAECPRCACQCLHCCSWCVLDTAVDRPALIHPCQLCFYAEVKAALDDARRASLTADRKSSRLPL